ncbi:type I toxin-antitoxin system SymE family toxin [Pectobacterium carotovorum subsp. carotovorum]|uniref:Type I addiction module toxin, SymE family n=1 Tax=Pectobacterium versatile TaxID=2488639 RepID=A0AAW3RWH7_9GAMM|nr:type I addiction module toxin, SymE family [Pectobacterium versatile]MCL6336621.1 type I toxin-antitoxin system SymE family toxin [Pectobacterium carotovorum subsp. carotovorum]MCL6349511.1 type I toxin-antitoxin system SymE family toxin [Pectobacterium carotovorum subsp. carotovorum]MCL6404021.1 type I toxin-antitoxin system SymE family toxin [Pectobacterium carotovorum subsp. carotovorum]
MSWHSVILSAQYNHTDFHVFGISDLCYAINLKGRWLEESGFIIGIPAAITVKLGRIIIETQINL